MSETEPARLAAERWLALVDDRRYAESWQAAAPLFQEAIGLEQWQGRIDSVRSPLGDLLSRKLISALPLQHPPKAPDGEYLVMQYQSRLARLPEAIETITPMRQADGSWRVAGYFIKAA